jgi:hypothetical protein
MHLLLCVFILYSLVNIALGLNKCRCEIRCLSFFKINPVIIMQYCFSVRSENTLGKEGLIQKEKQVSP